MTYEEKVERFWTLAEQRQMDCNQVALYMALLEIWRRNDYPSFLHVRNETICNLIGIKSVKTLRETRKRLIDNGLIIFEEGNSRKQPIYMLDSGILPAEIDIPLDFGEPMQVASPPSKKVEHERPRTIQEPDLFNKQKKPAKPRKEYTPPTMDEVKEVFDKAGSTDEEAEQFYYYYDSQDWYKANGKNRIMRLDSAVNSWLSRRTKNNGTEFKSDADKRKERNDEVANDILSHYR